MAEGTLKQQDLREKLADLFRKTGPAHHQAYLATDGNDPEWPIWYANYLHDPLAELLDASFTRSELIYLIVSVDKKQKLEASPVDWPLYYADFFIEQFS